MFNAELLKDFEVFSTLFSRRRTLLLKMALSNLYEALRGASQNLYSHQDLQLRLRGLIVVAGVH